METFLGNSKVIIDNGENTSFQQDVWWSERTLEAKFINLFELATDKNARVFDMGVWANNSWILNFCSKINLTGDLIDQ